MLANYGYIGLFLIAALFFALSMLLIPLVLRFLHVVPNKPSPAKSATYECGMDTIGKTWVQFNFRYYFYALMFIVLDVMVVFIYPWAVDLRRLGFSALAAVLVLVSIVAVGYLYAWKKKVLEWK